MSGTATTLKNVVRFGTVLAGATVSLPHFLNEDSRKLVPDLVIPLNMGFAVSADDTNITVTNPTAGPLPLDVYVEHWHTIEREFGPEGKLTLTPQPAIVDLGSLLNLSCGVLGFGALDLAPDEGGTGGTHWLFPWNMPNADEDEVPMVAVRSGTLSHLWVRHDDDAGNGQPVVYTVVKNGVPTALTVSLPSGAIGQAADLVHSVPVAEGDRIAMSAFVAAEGGIGAESDIKVNATMRYGV